MKRGLGRGLGSLFGDYENYEMPKTEEKQSIKAQQNVTAVDGVMEVEIGLVDRNDEQPRKNFDEKALKELAQSIKQHGIIQPLIVKEDNGRYIIIAGERRFRAARMAGLKKVPVIVKDYSEQQVSEVSIIENLQREDLNPIESAKAIEQLIQKYSLTQEAVADRIGKSRSAVTNTLRLLTLPKEVIEYVEAGRLSAGHAKTLLALEDNKKIIEVARLVVAKKLSVRDLEALIKKLTKPQKSTKVSEQSLELKDFVNSLNKMFSTKVSIIGNDNKGRIYIDYYSKADLQRIYDVLSK